MLYIGVAGTVHEVGHALYEQGRNLNYDNLPVSRYDIAHVYVYVRIVCLHVQTAYLAALFRFFTLTRIHPLFSTPLLGPCLWECTRASHCSGSG